MLIPMVHIPALVRMKPGALDRIGIYLQRADLKKVVVLHSHGLIESLQKRMNESLKSASIQALLIDEVNDASFESAVASLSKLPAHAEAVVGYGGGKALDVAKYVAFLANLPFFAVPTSLSNDGFCSPQSSLTLNGKRKSLQSRLPHGVIVDTQVCLDAPRDLWLSGVGDLVAKITAVKDWKLAFHKNGEPVNDLAALLSDSTVRQFMACPRHDPEGARLLGTALMLNGIAMEICGSSRPASGSEHNISHSLDHFAERPRLHGLQVGVASYLVSHLQQYEHETIGRLLGETGFFEAIRRDPFLRSDWKKALEAAPKLRPERYTILSEAGSAERILELIDEDIRVQGCFV